jgi:DNA-binding NtrC family response regulator
VHPSHPDDRVAGRRILIIDDEPLIRDFLVVALEDAGRYDVECAGSGEGAIAMLEAQPAGFAAIVTDIDLGSAVNGWRVGRRAREIAPKIGVVYITGAANAAAWERERVPESLFLEKPFLCEVLINAVNSVVETARDGDTD